MIIKWSLLALLMIAMSPVAISIADESSDVWLQKMEDQNREAQLQLEKSQLEMQRMNAEMDAFIAKRQQEELLNNAKQAAKAQEEAAQRAEEAADEVRIQLQQAEVKNKNLLFFVGIILLSASFLGIVVRKYKKGVVMKYHEKFGIVVVLVCGLLILFALMIAEGWNSRVDFISNFMMLLQIRMFPDVDGCLGYGCKFTIDFPAKYAVLCLLALAIYGFTTYLGITPALKRNVKEILEASPDIPSAMSDKGSGSN